MRLENITKVFSDAAAALAYVLLHLLNISPILQPPVLEPGSLALLLNRLSLSLFPPDSFLHHKLLWPSDFVLGGFEIVHDVALNLVPVMSSCHASEI